MLKPQERAAVGLSAGRADPPTHARYVVLGFLCCLSFVLYIDRVCIGQAELPIRRELGLSKTQMTFVLMAFTVAYGLFEVPTGRWGDKYGSRGVLTRIVLWWSAFTALTGAATGLVVLVTVRFLFGAGEAGAYPNAARVLSRWFPVDERGMAQGIVLTSALVGGALAPGVAAHLIEAVGWRWSFAVFGTLGVVWAAGFYHWFRDDPADHPRANEAERLRIAAGTDPDRGSPQHPPVPWRFVLTSANVWLLGGIQTCGAFASYMYMSWYPTYLQEARRLSQVEAGWGASLVLAGGAIGSFAGGYVANWVVSQSRDPTRARRRYGFCVMAIAAVSLAASIQFDSPVAAMLCAALASLSAQSQQATWWAIATEISGKHLGALFGLMNSLGVPGAVGSQFFLGAFADWRGSLGYSLRDQWDPAFYAYVGVLLVGACCWLFLDPARSAVEREAKPVGMA